MEPNERLTCGEPVAESSDRACGLVFAGGFAPVGLVPLLGGEPAWLAPCNRAWLRCGRGLQRIVHPVVRGLACFAAATPTGLALRTLGQDPLRLRRDPDAGSGAGSDAEPVLSRHALRQAPQPLHFGREDPTASAF